MPNIAITGATGLLGPYLIERGAQFGHVSAISRYGALACELSDPSAVADLMAHLHPDIVVHAAGFTSVDGCEREPDQADRANRVTAANLAAAVPEAALLVQISTDQVYPATPGPHGEGSEAPVNVYGRSKLAGEQAALGHRRTVVLRTNFFGASRTPGRTSLSDFVANNLAGNRPTPLFRDVLFSPLHMSTLATLVFDIARAGLTGVFNAGCRAGASKRDFGHMVARHLGLQTATAVDTVSSSLANRAARASDLRMDVSRLEKALGRDMPDLAAEIRQL